MKKSTERKSSNYLFLMCFLVLSCERTQELVKEDINLRDDLVKLISQPYDTIDIGKTFSKDFDSLYIFGPYYPLDSIEKRTKITFDNLKWGIDVKGKQKDLAAVDENANLILFKRNGTLNKYCLFPRLIGDFSKTTKRMYLPNEAKFVKELSNDSTQQWLNIINVE